MDLSGSVKLFRVCVTYNSYKVYVCLLLVADMCPTHCDPVDCSPPVSFVHGDSPGKNSRVGCHAFLQGIF